MNNKNYNINERQSSMDRSVERGMKQTGSAIWNGTKAVGRGLSFGVSGVWNALVRGSDKALDRIINEFTLMMIYGQQPKKNFLRRVWDNLRKKGNLVRALKIPGESKATMLDDINRCMAEVYNMYFKGEVTLEQIQGSFTGLGVNTALTMASDINTIGKFIFGENIVNESDFTINVNDIKYKKSFSDHERSFLNLDDEEQEEGQEELDDEELNFPDEENQDDEELNFPDEEENEVHPIDPEDNTEPEETEKDDNISTELKKEFNAKYNNMCYYKNFLYVKLINLDNKLRRYLSAFYEKTKDETKAKELLINGLNDEKIDAYAEFINENKSLVKQVRQNFLEFEEFINSHEELKGRSELFESDEVSNISLDKFESLLKHKVLIPYINNVVLKYTPDEFNVQIKNNSIELYNKLQEYYKLCIDGFIDTNKELFLKINYKKFGVVNSNIGIIEQPLINVLQADEENVQTTEDVFKEAKNIIKKVNGEDGTEYSFNLKTPSDIGSFMGGLYNKFSSDIDSVKEKFGVTLDKLVIPMSKDSNDKFIETINFLKEKAIERINKYKTAIEKINEAGKLEEKDFEILINNTDFYKSCIEQKYNDVTSLLKDKLREEEKPDNKEEKPDNKDIQTDTEDQQEEETEEDDEEVETEDEETEDEDTEYQKSIELSDDENILYKDPIETDDPEIKNLYKEKVQLIPLIDYMFGDIRSAREESMDLLKYYGQKGFRVDGDNNVKQLLKAIYNSVIAYFDIMDLYNSKGKNSFYRKNKKLINTQIMKVINIIDLKYKDVSKKAKKSIAKNVKNIIKKQLGKLYIILNNAKNSEIKLRNVIGNKIKVEFKENVENISNLNKEEQLKELKNLIDKTSKEINNLNKTKSFNVIYKDVIELTDKEKAEAIFIMHLDVIKEEYREVCKKLVEDVEKLDDTEDIEFIETEEINPDDNKEAKPVKETFANKVSKFAKDLFTDESTPEIINQEYNEVEEKAPSIRQIILSKMIKNNNRTNGMGKDLNKQDSKLINGWNRLENKKQLMIARDHNDVEAVKYSDDFLNSNPYSNKEVVKFIVNKTRETISDGIDNSKKFIKDKFSRKKKRKENKQLSNQGQQLALESLSESDILRVKHLRKQHGGMLNNYIAESEFNKLDTLQLLESYDANNFDKNVISDERMMEMCLLYETSPMEEKICKRLEEVFTSEDMEILENINEDLGLSKPINEINDNKTSSNEILSTDALFTINFDTNEIKANKQSYDIADLHRLISLGGAFADNYLNKSFSKLVTDMLTKVTEIANDRDEVQKQMRSFIGRFMNMIDAGQDDDGITRMFLGGGNIRATNTGQGKYMKRVNSIADKIINSGDKYIKAAGAKYKKRFTKHEVEEFNDFRLGSAWEARKIILQRGSNSIFESLYYMPAWGTALKFYFNYYPIAIYLVTSALANGDGRTLPENAIENAQSILTTKNY